ncbi:uncharacterized protein LOC122265903 isoform X1 [Penaeus japonicus]|uniref:uncharacterized protein LOC122265903 isoform X1 n=1 Tax=Penaeus japonicus TaxID=27405 RepID=UPI001C714425|nr:uncharacterized protein LOC122265903 isoform X1 [Penaeus japonicus]XP_042891310.1 uncharacterized protein LOC122265903 isoform X1 [Penaeus japonicus]XP_042891311.1 uncharacterized protein LOC122265903 isoform X1 [Penaeus japonicus]
MDTACIASELHLRQRGKGEVNRSTTQAEPATGSTRCPNLNGVQQSVSLDHHHSHIRDGSIGEDCQNGINSCEDKNRGLLSDTTEPLSSRMQEMLEGLNEPGDCGNPTEPPSWLDRDLFNRGRDFYYRYLFCMSFSEVLALVFMLSMTRALRPLMYTGRSDSPRKALRRYFSTFQHVTAWHEGDVWDPSDPAQKDLLSVRALHNRLSAVFNSSKEHDKVWNTTIQEKGHQEPTCPFYHTIREDLKGQAGDGLLLEGPDNPPFFISQWDMSLTQYQFMGLVVAHPHKMGAGAATDEDLEGLIHFWRGLGWLLGIQDKYNFCRGTLAEVRSLCLEVERLVGIPALAKADWNYEHMTGSLVSGLSHLMHTLSFEAGFRYVAYTLDLDIPNFISRMSMHGTIKYWLMRFAIGLLYYFPGLVVRLSHMLRVKTGAFKKRYARGMNEKGGSKTGELYPVTAPFTY